MKEHFQDYGVRKWAGDDLIELQSEPLTALQALVSPYAPCIISGCKVKTDDAGGYTVSAGLVALPGKDVKGEDCVKIVRTAGITIADNNHVCYLTLHHQTLTRTYMDGKSKAIVYDYTAQQTTIKPEDAPYLEISVNGGRRLVDALEITQKLDREGGEAKDVKVTFAEPPSDQEPEVLQSGKKLGALISNIKAWLNRKVDKKENYALSKNDFTDALLEKVNSVEKNANNYALPVATADELGGVKLGSDIVQALSAVSPKSVFSRTYPIQKDDNGRLVVNVPWANTTYSHPTTSGYKHIPTGGSAGQYLGWDSDGVAKWVPTPAIKLLAYARLIVSSGGATIDSGYTTNIASVKRETVGCVTVTLNLDNPEQYTFPKLFVQVYSASLYTIAHLYNVSNNSFIVTIRNKSGELMDADFSFSAIQVRA